MHLKRILPPLQSNTLALIYENLSLQKRVHSNFSCKCMRPFDLSLKIFKYTFCMEYAIMRVRM